MFEILDKYKIKVAFYLGTTNIWKKSALLQTTNREYIS